MLSEVILEPKAIFKIIIPCLLNYIWLSINFIIYCSRLPIMQLVHKLFLGLFTYFWPTDPVPPYPICSWNELPREEWPIGYDPISDSFPKKGSTRYQEQDEEFSALAWPQGLQEALV